MMELPASWSLDKISDHALIRQEKINPTLQSNEAFYLLGLENIESNTGQLLNTKMTKGTEIKSIKNAFHPNDILYGKLRPNLNKVALMSDEGICSTDIFVITCKTTIIPEYLAAYLRSDFVLNRVVQLAVGGQLPRLNAKDFLQLPIPIPPLEEQKEIVLILQEAEKLRRLRQDSLEKAEKLASALFIEMFGNILSNDKNWNTKKFRKIGKRRLGKMLDKGKEQGGQQYPYLANFNVQWNHLNLDELRTMVFSKQDREEFSLQDGDLLICEGGEIGRTSIWKGGSQNIFFQKALHRVRLDTQLTVPEYILHYMWFMAQYGGFRGVGNSATIAHLTGVQLDNLSVPLPPIELQERFAKNISDIEEQQQHVRAQLENIEQLLAVLQQQAFSGKLTESWRQSRPHLQAPTIKARHIKIPEETVITHRKSLFPQQRNRKAIYDQLSEFQRMVWDYFLENSDKYLPDDMPTIIAELPDSITEKDQKRLQTTLATLTTLGLLKKVSIANNEGEFIPVYRALRDNDEHHLFRHQEDIVNSEAANPHPTRKRHPRKIRL